MTAVAWDRGVDPLASLPAAVIAGEGTADVSAALARAFGATLAPPTSAPVPSSAVCIAVPSRGRLHVPLALADHAGPVLLVGSRCPPTWQPGARPVLAVPTGSSTGQGLLAHLVRWAAALDVDVWLATVVTDVQAGDDGRTDLLAAGLLGRMARLLALDGIDAGWDVLYGRSVSGAIRSFVDDFSPGLVAMEARPRTGRRDLWTSAVSVARAADVPVLLLPPSLPAPRVLVPVPVPLARPAPPRRRQPPDRTAPIVAVAAPMPARSPIPKPILIGIVVVLAIALAVLAQVRVPYDSVQPGAAPRLASLIHIDGAVVYPPSRPIRFLTIETRTCTVFDAVRGWIDRDVDVVPDHLDPVEVESIWQANRKAMEDAKRVAGSVALRRLGWELPVEIDIDTADVVGPSAGLAFTLALLDSLTPGDLAGDLDVAATGTIDADGLVGPVGGLRQKVITAQRAGVDLLLVPAGQQIAAARYANGRLDVVGVGSLADSLDLLQARSS